MHASLSGGLWPGCRQVVWQSPLREKREVTQHPHFTRTMIPSGLPDRVALQYTYPTPEAAHWASLWGRPQHWYVKGHVPPCKRKNSGFRGQWSLKIIESGTKVVRFESLSTVSYSQSIVTMAVSCIISEIKQDIGRNRDFSYHLHSTPPLGGPRHNPRYDCFQFGSRYIYFRYKVMSDGAAFSTLKRSTRRHEWHLEFCLYMRYLDVNKR